MGLEAGFGPLDLPDVRGYAQRSRDELVGGLGYGDAPKVAWAP